MPQREITGEQQLLYDKIQKVITGSSNLDNIIDEVNERYEGIQHFKSKHDPKYYSVLDTSIDILNSNYDKYIEDKSSIDTNDMLVDIIELDILLSWLEKYGGKNKTLIGVNSDTEIINKFLSKIPIIIENIHRIDESIISSLRTFMVNYEQVMDKLAYEIVRLEAYYNIFSDNKQIKGKLNDTLNKFNNNLKLSVDKLKIKDGQILTVAILDKILEQSKWKREAHDLGKRVKPPVGEGKGKGEQVFAVSRKPLPKGKPLTPSKSTVERRGRGSSSGPPKLFLEKPKPLDEARKALFTKPSDTEEALRLSTEIPDPKKHSLQRSPTQGVEPRFGRIKSPSSHSPEDKPTKGIHPEREPLSTQPSNIDEARGHSTQEPEEPETRRRPDILPKRRDSSEVTSPLPKKEDDPWKRVQPLLRTQRRRPQKGPYKPKTPSQVTYNPGAKTDPLQVDPESPKGKGHSFAGLSTSAIKEFLKKNVYDVDRPKGTTSQIQGDIIDYDDLNDKYNELIKKIDNYNSFFEQTKRRINTIGKYNADNFVYKLDDFGKNMAEYENKLSTLKDNYEEVLSNVKAPLITFDSNKPENIEAREKQKSINEKLEKINLSIERLKEIKDELDKMVYYITNKHNIELYGRDDINTQTQNKDIQDLYYKLRNASRRQTYSPEYENLCERAKSIHKKELNVDKRTKKYGQNQELYERISNELDKCYNIAQKDKKEKGEKAKLDKAKEIESIEKRIEQKYKLKLDPQQLQSSQEQTPKLQRPQEQTPKLQRPQEQGPREEQGQQEEQGPQEEQGQQEEKYISSKGDEVKPTEKSEGLLKRLSPFGKKDNIKEIHTVLNEKGDMIGDTILDDNKKETLQRVDNTLKASDDVNKVYYELLDEYYLFKKEANTTNNKHVRLLIKREKEIDELKSIIISLKSNLEQFRDICEKKALDQDLTYQKEKKKINKESHEVFDYLEDLFNEEIKNQLKELKIKLKILKEDKKQLKNDKKLTKKKKRGRKKGKKKR